MLWLPVPSPFVCSGAATVLVGLVQGDGVAVVADRAAVLDGEMLAPGVPWPADDRVKVFATADGLIGGFAGKASSPSRDLPAELPRVLAGVTTVLGAVERVMEIFDEVADEFREHAGYGPADDTVFGVPVLTVALIGGVRSQQGYLVAVALPHEGRSRQQELTASAVWTPQVVQAEADLMRLTDAGAAPVAEMVGRWGSRLPQLAALSASRGRLPISEVYDFAAVTAGGSTGVRSVGGASPEAAVPRF